MNIMSLDAAYGEGTMAQMQQVPRPGPGEPGDEGSVAQQQHSANQPPPSQARQQQQQGFSRFQPSTAQPPPPETMHGRHTVAQYPGPPVHMRQQPSPPHPQPPQPPQPPQHVPVQYQGPPPPSHPVQYQGPPPPHPPPQHAHSYPHPHPAQQQHHLPLQQQPPLAMQPPPPEPRDISDRFATDSGDEGARKKSKKVRFVAGATESSSPSFYEKNKGLIIALVTIVFLILGVLIAVLIAKKAKGSNQGSAALAGGAPGGEGAAAFDPNGPMPGFHYGVMDGSPAPVPQFVGGGPHSALPLRAWNESASVYVRR